MQSSTARRLARTVVVIFSWYCISAIVILTTKWVLSKPLRQDKHQLFPFPLIVTTFSNTLTTVWAFVFSRHHKLRPPILTKAQLKRYVLPIGLITAMDIGLSNIALKILTVSFGTIIKGSAPVFTMLWGLIFGIEYYSSSVCAALFTISFGIGLAVFGEGSDFLLHGFLLQLTATSLAGLRWAITQVLLKGQGEPMPPIAAVLYTSPATALCIAPFAAIVELPSAIQHLQRLQQRELWILLVLLSIIGTLVFVLLVSEYWLVSDTSSLALSVAAVFKELMTIMGGILIFKDNFTPLNIAGFVTCQAGIGAYVFLRYNADERNTRTDAQISDEEAPLALHDADENLWDEGLSPIAVSRSRSVR